MNVTFDPAKNSANLKQHQMDLNACSAVFNAPMLTVEDSRLQYGEQRLQTLGWLSDHVVFMVWVDRQFLILFLAERQLNMKQKSISKPSNPFTAAQMAAALANAPESTVFDNDSPETHAADWQEAIISHSYAQFKEGIAKKRLGRPLSSTPKVQVAIRFDQDILAAFKATGRGWQTRLNDLLRKHLDEVRP